MRGPRRAALTSACPVCGASGAGPAKAGSLTRELRPDDLRITDDRYGWTLALYRCRACTFVFADPAETGRLGELYARLDDPGYHASSEARRLQMRWLLAETLRRRPEARTLLDVGAATGALLAEAAALGLAAEGVEPSRSLAAGAAAAGHRVHVGVLPHPDVSGHFDLVTLVDVIEHVGDPVGLLASAAARLAPGGLLVVVTPDLGSLAARVLGNRWWHHRLAHVGYFTDRSLRTAAARAGLRVEGASRAKWFFPVGYLAQRVERYLPVARLNRLARRVPGVGRLYDVVVPLDLRDSTVFFLSGAAGG